MTHLLAVCAVIAACCCCTLVILQLCGLYMAAGAGDRDTITAYVALHLAPLFLPFALAGRHMTRHGWEIKPHVDRTSYDKSYGYRHVKPLARWLPGIWVGECTYPLTADVRWWARFWMIGTRHHGITLVRGFRRSSNVAGALG